LPERNFNQQLYTKYQNTAEQHFMYRSFWRKNIRILLKFNSKIVLTENFNREVPSLRSMMHKAGTYVSYKVFAGKNQDIP